MAARTIPVHHVYPPDFRVVPAAPASTKPDAPWNDRYVEGFYGRIAVRETSGAGLPLVLIHGETSSKDIFRLQMLDALGARHRLVAIDLPGYGASEALAGADGSSLTSFADAVVDTIERLGIERFALLGWSLGASVALEAAAGTPGVAGVMIVGMPSGDASEPGRELHRQANGLAARAGGPALHAPMGEALSTTDARPPSDPLQAVAASTRSDQRAIATSLAVPLAVVNGANDPMVRFDPVDSAGAPLLWEGRAHTFPFAGRAPFLDAPELFNATLARFLHHLESEQPAAGAHLCFAG